MKVFTYEIEFETEKSDTVKEIRILHDGKITNCMKAFSQKRPAGVRCETIFDDSIKLFVSGFGIDFTQTISRLDEKEQTLEEVVDEFIEEHSGGTENVDEGRNE